MDLYKINGKLLGKEGRKMNLKDIRQVIKLLDENPGLVEIEVNTGFGQRIRVSRSDRELPVSQKPQPLASTEVAPKVAEVTWEKALKEIKSPMVGTFYRAPGPGQKPFVEENSRVKPGDPVCIIEAMKLLNEIPSEFSGRIARILVESKSPVQYGQVLMLVEPD